MKERRESLKILKEVALDIADAYAPEGIVKSDMYYQVAQLSRVTGELHDIQTRVRDQKLHSHHPVDLLKIAERNGVVFILKNIDEIVDGSPQLQEKLHETYPTS